MISQLKQGGSIVFTDNNGEEITFIVKEICSHGRTVTIASSAPQSTLVTVNKKPVGGNTG